MISRRASRRTHVHHFWRRCSNCCAGGVDALPDPPVWKRHVLQAVGHRSPLRRFAMPIANGLTFLFTGPTAALIGEKNRRPGQFGGWSRPCVVGGHDMLLR